MNMILCIYKVKSEKIKIYVKIINILILSLHGRFCMGNLKNYYTI